MAETDPIVGKTILELDPVTGQIDRNQSYVEIHTVGDAYSKRISLAALALHGLSAKEVVQLTHPEIVTDEDFINFITGTDGKSAFQLAVDGGFTGTQAEWLVSLKGTNGTDGTNGTNGTNGTDGKSAYQIALDNGFVGTPVAWLASLKGVKGDDGEDGAAGKSAYQLAVDGGFVGDVTTWLNSLKGTNGTDGTNGTNGTNGVDGDSAYEVAVAAGFVGNEAAWLLSLKGAKGDDGRSAYQVAVAAGFVGTESQWLVSLKGAKGDDGTTAVLGNLQGALDSVDDLPPVEEYVNADYFWIGNHCWMNLNGEWTDMGDFRGLPGLDGSGITVLGELPGVNYLPEVGDRNGDSWLIGKSMFVWNGARWQEQGQEGLRGPQGLKGDTGDVGKSSFEVVRQAYPEINTMPLYVEFIRGLQGEKGDTAVSFVADGIKATVGELPTPGVSNHGWLVGTAPTFDFHVWVNGAYVNLGNNVGPQGLQGDRGLQGLQGPVGRSMTPKGELANTGLLPGAGNIVGDYYSILGHFHAWDGGTWIDLGLFKGAKGDTGDTGPVGQPINAKGELASIDDLPTSGNVNGDGYEIGGYIYVYGSTGFKRMGQWRGVNGTSGTNGKSAYQIAVDGGFVGTESEWLVSLKGENGQVFDFIGNYASPAVLRAAHPTPANGLAAITQDTTPYHVYLSDDGLWEDAGPVGVRGEQGVQGEIGPDGKSAYQVALDNGFVGDVTAWLASLKGLRGDAGKSAYQVAVDGGYVGTEAAWLLTLKGADGTNGKSAYQLAQDAGFGGDVNAWLASLKGVKGDDGDVGPAGPPIRVLGQKANQAALPAVAGAAEGDAWTLADTGHVWCKVSGVWVDLGIFRGADGAAGKSAYQIAVDGGFVGNEAAWLLTLVGPRGTDGTNGTNGTNGVSLTFVGNYANQAALPAGTLSQVATAAGRVYIHNGTVWVDSGAVGVQGIKGDTGDTGKSAYEVAVQQGFVGNVAAWLASLVGATGATGKSLYQDAVDRGVFTGTFAEFVASQKGATGASAREDAIANGVVPPGTSAADFITFITGPQGIQGDTGATGQTGPAISIIGTLANEAALPGTGVAGTGYAIPDPAEPELFNCWIWLSTTTQWFNLGHVVGSQGPQGDQGPRGLQGLRGLAGDKGDQGTLWLVFPRDPQAIDGRINDYFFNNLTQEFFRKTSSTVWASLGHIGGGNLNAPSSDGKRKVMLDGGWVDTPLLNDIAATGDKVRGVKNGLWIDVPLVNSIPADATGVYQLINGAWVKFDIYTLAVIDAAFTSNVATINWASARQFRMVNNTAGSKTVNLTNIPGADRAATVIVKVVGKTAAFVWTLPSGSIRWFDGAAPTFTNDITTVVFNWDGVEMVGSVPN